MKKELYLLFTILLFALAIRLYPTIATGMPFSTDAWPLIRNTELLIQNTPVPLNSGIFDIYNNFWPGNQLFGATLSQIINLPPITAMALGIPIAAALTIPIFYFLVKKLTENKKIALTATALIAAAFPYTFFTAGVTKETFASPIYMTLILLFLLKHDKKTTLLFSIASIALALTHHLTAFFATATILALSIAYYSSKATTNDQEINSNKSNILFAAIQAAVTLIYLGFFASPGFNSNLPSSTLLTVAAYQILFIALTLQLVYFTKKLSKTRALFQFILGSLLSIGIMIIIIDFCTLPGAHMLYAAPLIIGLPLAIFGLNEVHKRNTSLTIPLFWLISILAFTGFAVFSNPPDASGFAWRSINFILPPLMILIAIGLNKLYTSPKHLKTQRFAKSIAVLIILAIISTNTYGMYATVSIQDPSLGYAWLYYPSDYKASNWIATNANNQTTGGDARVEYLLQQYYNKTVDLAGGLRYLEGNGSPPEILYIYNQMSESGKGYILVQGYSISLPANWTDQLSNYNCIYTNNEVTIYARK